METIRTILICDDEASLRELVRATLDSGYRFAEATDGFVALELADELRPDLVVLDLMLPRTSGLDVLTQIRSHPHLGGTPVVVITAWSDAEDAAHAAGADRFVAKPFEPDELKSIVEELLADR
ncbi:MAG: response regulator [Gaiellaceae bacterium]